MQEQVERYGIDSLKTVTKFAFLATNEALTIDKNADGDITIPEIFSSITTLAFKFPDLYEAFPQLKKEWKDFSEAEKEEMRAFINKELDLPMKYDNIEAALKIIVNALHYNYRQWKKLVSLFQDTAEA